MKQESGFTIVELLLVIGLILIIGGFALSFGLDFYRSRILENEATRIATTLREAQGKALYEKRDSSFGVKFRPNSYVFFQGDSFSNREIELDLTYDLPEAIDVKGVDEVVFLQGSGTPNFTGAIKIEAEKKEQQININSEGKIEIQK